MIERRGTDSSRIMACTLGSVELNLTRKGSRLCTRWILMLTRSEIIIAYCPHRSQAFAQSSFFFSLFSFSFVLLRQKSVKLVLVFRNYLTVIIYFNYVFYFVWGTCKYCFKYCVSIIEKFVCYSMDWEDAGI